MTIRTIIVPISLIADGTPEKLFNQLSKGAVEAFERTYPNGWDLIYKGPIEYASGRNKFVGVIYQFWRNDGKNIIETFPEGFKTS